MGLIALAKTYHYLLPFSLAHGKFFYALWYNSKAVTTTRDRFLSCWKQVNLNPNTFDVSANNCTIKHMATGGFRRNGFFACASLMPAERSWPFVVMTCPPMRFCSLT